MLDLYSDRFRDTVCQQGLILGIRLFARTAVNFLLTGATERLEGRRKSRSAYVKSPVASGIGVDLRDAIRSTRRSARLSLAAVACIGLGTAASSAILTLYSSAVLRPLPFPDSGRLVRVWLDDPGVEPRRQLTLPDVRDLESQLTRLDPFVAAARSRIMFLGDRGARRVEGEAVTLRYFDLLGIEPFIGRAFLPDEFSPGSEPVMVLSFGTWNTHFGADRDILGTTIRTAIRNYTVVGVLPPDFLGTIEDDIPDIEFWIPMEQDRTEEIRQSREGSGYIWTIGRLGPGVEFAQAQQEVRAIGTRLAEQYPETRGPMGLRVEPLGENWREDLRGQSHLLLAAAGLLLLVAASNAAGLFTARSLARLHEMAIRAALGAARSRLIRQVFIETTILVAVGSSLGTLIAPFVLRTFLSIAPNEIPEYVSITLDLRTLGLVLLVLAVTAVASGILPAILGSRVDPAGALGARGTTASHRERRMGNWLVTAEIAMTTVLVVTAGLLLRSYNALSQTELGFRTEQLLRMAIFVDVRDVDRAEDLSRFHRLVRETLLQHPGVQEVGLVWPTVPPGTGGDMRLTFDDMPQESREHGLFVHMHMVDPYFLPTMDMELIAGRNIDSGDRPGTRRVVVVSQSLADLMGGAERALGKAVETDGSTFEVVGVAHDVLYFGAVERRQHNFDLYTALAQEPTRLVSVAVTTAGDPTPFVGPLSERLNDLAPNSALDWVDPMTVALGSHFRGPRFYLVLLGSFATSALLLTAVGLFAVLASLVAKQTGEFGIRCALGADRLHIVASVLLRGLRIAAFGLGIGATCALLVSWILSRTLYGVGAFDCVTFVATALLIGAVSASASLLPAMKAARVSPLQALETQ
jgi:predicted permease